MLPALPALLAVSLTLLAAPFPWVDAAGLPPTSPPVAPGAVDATPGPAPAGQAAAATVRREAAGSRLAAPAVTGRRFGPLPAVVGPVLPVVGPEFGRTGRSSATVAPAPPPVPVVVAVPVPVPAPVVPAPVVPAPVVRRAAPPVTTPPAPAPAPAPPPPVAPDVEVDPAGGEWLRRRAAEVLAQVSFDWRALGYEVAFLPARSGVRARTLRVDTRIEVFARRSDPVRQTAFDLAHEIGHAVDFQRITWEQRARWQHARGIDAAIAWFGCNGCGDLSTPAGDFAESFAVWQVPGGPFGSTLGRPPGETQRVLLAELSAP